MKNNFTSLWRIVKKLRKECPWDRVQTFSSLRFSLIEESYELYDALRSRNYTKIEEEIGDLLFLLFFFVCIGEEKRKWELSSIVERVSEKLIHRHPHVFKKRKVKNVEEVLVNWEKLKKKETGSMFAGIPKFLPALRKAQILQFRASRVNFDWQDYKGPLGKTEEELRELKEELQKGGRDRIREELGDLLFCITNLSRHLRLDAEESLNRSCKKFVSRFKKLEKKLSKSGRTPQQTSLAEMDKIWEGLKKS